MEAFNVDMFRNPDLAKAEQERKERMEAIAEGRTWQEIEQMMGARLDSNVSWYLNDYLEEIISMAQQDFMVRWLTERGYTDTDNDYDLTHGGECDGATYEMRGYFGGLSESEMMHIEHIYAEDGMVYCDEESFMSYTFENRRNIYYALLDDVKDEEWRKQQNQQR